MGTFILNRQQTETTLTALRTAVLSYEAGARELRQMGDQRSAEQLERQALEADALYDRITAVVEAQ